MPGKPIYLFIYRAAPGLSPDKAGFLLVMAKIIEGAPLFVKPVSQTKGIVEREWPGTGSLQLIKTNGDTETGEATKV